MSQTAQIPFRKETSHQAATSPDEFIYAAEILEAGGTWDQMKSVLTAQHLTSLFYVQNRPPMPMLMDAGSKEAAKILRAEAAKLESE